MQLHCKFTPFGLVIDVIDCCDTCNAGCCLCCSCCCDTCQLPEESPHLDSLHLAAILLLLLLLLLLSVAVVSILFSRIYLHPCLVVFYYPLSSACFLSSFPAPLICVSLSVALSLSGTRVWLPMRPFVSCGSSRRTVVATSPEFCLLCCCCCCCCCVLLLSLALPLPPLSYCHFRFLSLAVLPQLRLEFSRVEFIVRSSVLSLLPLLLLFVLWLFVSLLLPLLL